MKINNKDLSNLFKEACESENGLSRICLHNEPSNKVQLMIIAAKPGKIYPAISDNLDGWITYTVLKGSLIIKTYKNNLISTKNNLNKEYSLSTGETLKIDRNIFRETICDIKYGAIYMEVIEGHFDKSQRTYLQNL